MAQPAEMVALMDGLVSGRVYHGRAKQTETTPYIVFDKISSQPVNNLDGTDGTRNTRYQIDCWATDADAAETLLNAIKTAFEPVSAQYVQLGDNPDFFDADAKLHRASADFSVWHT